MSDDATSDGVMIEIAAEWLATCRIIADFLKELRPDLTQSQHDHNAAAIIARLAKHDPPILAGFAREDE